MDIIKPNLNPNPSLTQNVYFYYIKIVWIVIYKILIQNLLIKVDEFIKRLFLNILVFIFIGLIIKF